MIEPFSANYFLGHFRVYPADDERAAMDATEYAVLQDFCGGVGQPVMKLSNYHFRVQKDADVPLRSLAIPEHILADAGITEPPTSTEVLIAKNEGVAQMLGL